MADRERRAMAHPRDTTPSQRPGDVPGHGRTAPQGIPQGTPDSPGQLRPPGPAVAPIVLALAIVVLLARLLGPGVPLSAGEVGGDATAGSPDATAASPGAVATSPAPPSPTVMGGDPAPSEPAGSNAADPAARPTPAVTAPVPSPAAPTPRPTTRPSGAPPTVAPWPPAPVACEYRDLATPHATAADWARTLVDTVYRVPSSFAPPDLVSSAGTGLGPGFRLRDVARADLTALASAARAAGSPLALASAYRSHATQVSTYAEWVAKSGEAAARLASARPGHSEHQLGTAFDFRSAGGSDPWLADDWARSPAGAWMAANAWRYGLVMSYPPGAQATSCYKYEPWHYRYVGRQTAAAIHAAGLVPRAYLWRLQ